jgi:hypothetical protein
MDHEDADARLRARVHLDAPGLGKPLSWERVQQEVSRRRRRRAAYRVAGVVMVSSLVLLGGFRAYQELRQVRPTHLVVITARQDTSSTTASTASQLAGIEARLVGQGIPVLSVTDEGVPGDSEMAKKAFPNAALPFACVRVRSADIAPPDGVFEVTAIRREVVWLMRSGLDLRYLSIVGVDERGNEIRNSMSLMSGNPALAAADSPAGTTFAEAKKRIQAAVQEVVASSKTLTATTDVTDAEDGRHVVVDATLGVNQVHELGVLVDAIEAGVSSLNSEGAKVSYLGIRLNTTDGKALARYVVQLAAGKVWSMTLWEDPQVQDQAGAKPEFAR